jgi:hypothetical protein
MKLGYFKPGLLSGKTLHLDLDNVVCGNLDALLALEPDPLIMTHDVVYPGLPNAGTLLFYPERLDYLWKEYVKNPRNVQLAYSQWPKASDQAYMAKRVEEQTGQKPPFFQSLLPNGYILNSKVELEAGRYPYDKTSLVNGCWIPKPHEPHNDYAQKFYDQHWRE